MKKTYISLFAFLLLVSLLFSACVSVKDNNGPTVPSSSDSSTQDTAGFDDDFTTDLDIFTDLIPDESSEPETSEGLDVIATSEPDNEDNTPATTEATEPEPTEPETTEKKPEPVVPSPTNSNGEIELPMIPG